MVFRSGLFLLLGGAVALGQPAFDELRLERVAQGLSNPLFVTAPPGDTARLFIVEQRAGTTGRVRLLDLATGTLAPTPFLSVPGVTTGGEQGLLGLAFHPAYASNGYLFVNYTTSDASVNPVSPHGVTRIVRYQVSADDPAVADPASATTVLSFPQPFSNHNGGWIGFGPDGFLYIATGDGGLGNDTLGAAQRLLDNPSTPEADEALLGKLLRLDVDRDDFPSDPDRHYGIPAGNPFVGDASGRDEIWAYGLRNPWRCAFDRGTGDLWIGDVGQGSWEEIDFQPASSTGGENYGWRAREGLHDNPAVGDPAPVPRVEPVLEYSHSEGFSVTGGYVYRGAAMPWLQGAYVYSDFGSAFVRSFRWNGASMEDVRTWTDALNASLPPGQHLDAIASYGEDGRGELYLVDLGGEVFRLTQSPFNRWRSEYFTTPELVDGLLAGPVQDPDGDGFSNEVEFVSGGDPRRADGPWGPVVTTVEVGGARYLELSWELDPARAGGYTLTPEATGDAAAGGWTGEALEVLEASSSRFRVRDGIPLTTDTRRWLRVAVAVE